MHAPALPTDTRTIVADEVPLHLDSLIPRSEARVREAKDTREPGPSSANVSPEASSSGHRMPKDKPSGKENSPRITGPNGHRVGMKDVNKLSFDTS